MQENRRDNRHTVQAEDRGQEATNALGRNAQNARPNVENPATVNHPEQENHLALMERPDQAEGLQPFTTTVMRALMPDNKVLLAMEKYCGSTDPEKHLRSFVDAMAVYSSDDFMWCKAFSLSLKGEALNWFHSLEPGTIDGFATLWNLFGQQYASSKA